MIQERKYFLHKVERAPTIVDANSIVITWEDNLCDHPQLRLILSPDEAIVLAEALCKALAGEPVVLTVTD